MVEFLIFISVVFFALAIWSFSQQPRLKREREEREAELKRKQEEVNSIIKNLDVFYKEKIEPNIKSKDSIVTIVQKPAEDRFKTISYFLWKENSCLLFCPVNSNENYAEFINDQQKLGIISLKLSDIEYYTLRKTEKSELRSSGGEISGGGSSLAGAVVGGVVAGGVGAVIGSRKQIKGTPLKIETINIEKTDLYINYYGVDSIKHTLFLMPENFKHTTKYMS